MHNVLIANIPDALKHERRWVVWRGAKVPYQCHNSKVGTKAKADDSSTWSTFDEAIHTRHCEGISFALGDGYTGFDFDNVRDSTTGAIEPTALLWITHLDSYTEVSPSQRGIKTIVGGRLDATFLDNRRTGRKFNAIPQKGMAVEIYDKRRFFTVTGHSKSNRFNSNQQGIDVVCREAEKLWEQGRPKPQRKPIAVTPAEQLSDEAVLEKIRQSRQGMKFTLLWTGFVGEYQSESEADFALASMLNFWCCNDANQVERLFSQSERGKRDKWTEREDYRTMTIQNAQSVEVYDPERRGA